MSPGVTYLSSTLIRSGQLPGRQWVPDPRVRGSGTLVLDDWGDHHVVAGDGQFG